MKIEYRKNFLKELSKIPSNTREKIEKFIFSELPELDTIFESGKIEQMKGYPQYYKMRFGVYRVGLKLENDTVIFERALHRKNIYRYYPN